MAHRELQSKLLSMNQNKLIKELIHNILYNLPSPLNLAYCSFYDESKKKKKKVENIKSRVKISDYVVA